MKYEAMTFTTFPEPVGYWKLYEGASTYTQFAIYKRPTDVQIKNTEEFLGWTWVEAQEK